MMMMNENCHHHHRAHPLRRRRMGVSGQMEVSCLFAPPHLRPLSFCHHLTPLSTSHHLLTLATLILSPSNPTHNISPSSHYRPLSFCHHLTPLSPSINLDYILSSWSTSVLPPSISLMIIIVTFPNLDLFRVIEINGSKICIGALESLDFLPLLFFPINNHISLIMMINVPLPLVCWLIGNPALT